MSANSSVESDVRLLRQIGRDRGTVRSLVERRHGGNCDRLLKRLLAEGRINVMKNALPGGLSWYQLTEAEARRLGMPEPSPATQRTLLRKNATLLCSTARAGGERVRLVPSECRHLSGDDSLISPHIAARTGGDSAIYRVFIPEAKAKDEPFLNAVRQHAFKALEHPRITEWVRRDTYRFLILLHAAETAADIRPKDLERIANRKSFPTITLRFEAVPLFEQLYDSFGASPPPPPFGEDL